MFLVLFGVFACSQTQAPEKVATAFKAKFPAASAVEWGKESDTEFEAEFKMNGREMSANFDAGGKWLETEAVLVKDDLPAPVLYTLESKFGNSEVRKIESVEKAGETVVYEVKLEQDENELEVLLDAGGRILRQEPYNEEREEED